jgi:hypothetical protein
MGTRYPLLGGTLGVAAVLIDTAASARRRTSPLGGSLGQIQMLTLPAAGNAGAPFQLGRHGTPAAVRFRTAPLLRRWSWPWPEPCRPARRPPGFPITSCCFGD